MGSVADYIEVDRSYERAVEACLGEALQHVVVSAHDQAVAGLRLARERNAGRVGFVVAGEDSVETAPAAIDVPEGLTPIVDLVRVSGPAATAIRSVLAYAWVAPDFDSARGRRARAPGNGRYARRRRLARYLRRRGWRPRGSQGHPDDEAGDQGAARACRESARGGRSRARGAFRGRFAHRRRGVGDAVVAG